MKQSTWTRVWDGIIDARPIVRRHRDGICQIAILTVVGDAQIANQWRDGPY